MTENKNKEPCECPVDKWEQCYESSYQGIITPESFCHPAKMSRSLLERIYDHAFAEGWLKEGSVVVDCFGGILTTGILGAYRNVQVIGIELEKRFCDLAEENLKLHDNAWRKLGCPRPVMIRGDSRRLASILQEADLIVSSPPYTNDGLGHPRGESATAKDISRGMTQGHTQGGFTNRYGQTPGQLGQMKPGSVEAIISSPPYAETDVGGHGEGPGMAGNEARRKCIYSGKGNENAATARIDGYGSSPGNIAALPPGEINAIISSPPYKGCNQAKTFKTEEDTERFAKNNMLYKTGRSLKAVKHVMTKQRAGDSPDNLGNSQGDTFWSSAKTILEQCHAVLKSGGHAIFVVKSFIRKGKQVDFPGDWRRLCEAAGFETLHEHHAMLFKSESNLVFDFAKNDRTERVSFFRRNANNKGAWRNYWQTIRPDQQRRWLSKTAKRTGIGKYKKLLVKAQQAIFKHMGEVHWDWNDDIRIDWENVICCKKSENGP